jgi:phage terminase small subunit
VSRTANTSPATSRRTAGPTSAPTLTERERNFIERYMGDAAGNATKAARLAGYSAKTARKQGSRLLTKGHIRAAIAQRTKDDPGVWTREDRQRFWTAVASGASGYQLAALRDRLKASELLGKSQADFVERHQVDAGGTLVDLLAAVTARREWP